MADFRLAFNGVVVDDDKLSLGSSRAKTSKSDGSFRLASLEVEVQAMGPKHLRDDLHRALSTRDYVVGSVRGDHEHRVIDIDTRRSASGS